MSSSSDIYYRYLKSIVRDVYRNKALYNEWGDGDDTTNRVKFILLKYNFVEKGIVYFNFKGKNYKIFYKEAPSVGGMGQQPDYIEVIPEKESILLKILKLFYEFKFRYNV